MKSMLRWCVALLCVFHFSLGFAAPAGIYFDGPKITYEDGPNLPILMPDNFAVYPFMGNPLNDAAVPHYMRHILGMDNLDNWPSVTHNTYFDVNPVMHVGNHIHQVTQGNFDASGASDLLAINTVFFNVCYNFTGTACGSISDQYHVNVIDAAGAEHKSIPFAGAVADFNGDAKDDVAIISYSVDTYQGYLTVYVGNQTNAAKPLNEPPYYQAEIPDGIPLSLAVGDYSNDGTPNDIVVASQPDGDYAGGAFGTFFHNTGGTFTLANHVFDFPRGECYSPTGLVSYDGDTGDDDLVLTCYRALGPCGPAAIACIPTIISGPVVIFKNDGGGMSFSAQQKLNGLEFPYSSSLGDFNGDSQTDVAVASNGGKAVFTFAGTAPFQVAEPGNKISTDPFTPKFIQTQAMNGDTLPDLILTANDVQLPVQRQITDRVGFDTIVNRLSLARATVLVPKQANLLGKIQYASQANFLPSLSAKPVVFERQVERVGDILKYSYQPNRIQKEYDTGYYYQKDDSEVGFLDYYIEAVPEDDVERLPTHGVLVLINSRPEVSISEPDCDQTQVTYRCTGTVALPVVECVFASSDPSLTATPATPAGPAVEMTGTVTLPNDQNTHHFTVTAKDSIGNTVTGDFTVDFSKCPGEEKLGCPAEALSKFTVGGLSYTVCAFENDKNLADKYAGSTVTWVQTKGPDIFTGSKVIMDPAAASGSCLTGTMSFTWYDYEGNNDENREIELLYSVAGGPQNCPVKLVTPLLAFEGSGAMCSMGIASASGQVGVVILGLLLPFVGMLWIRKRSS